MQLKNRVERLERVICNTFEDDVELLLKINMDGVAHYKLITTSAAKQQNEITQEEYERLAAKIANSKKFEINVSVVEYEGDGIEPKKQNR